jgi:hypothetical protein
MNFDAEDTAVTAVVAFAAAVMAGLGTFAAFGVSLSDTFVVASGTFSLAYLGQVGSFGWTLWTNEHGIDPGELREQARSELTDTYYYLLMGSGGVLLAWPFVPEVSSFVQSQDLWGVVFILGSVGSQIALGYMR